MAGKGYRISDMGYRKLTEMKKKVKGTASFFDFGGIILSEIRGFTGLEGCEGSGAGYLRPL